MAVLARRKAGESKMPDLFVYGTLMPDYGNYRRIADHVRCARPATTRGILVDLGAFPALIPGDGEVMGILLTVDPEALRITDYIEGYHPDRERSLYVRKQVDVDLSDGKTVTAWIYFFANPDQIQDRPRLRVSDADGVPLYAWPAE